MEPLDKSLRSKLEKSIKEAREIAESAAANCLQQLGVGDSSAPSYLTPEQRDLRKALRIHGRQLGDLLNSSTQKQELDYLTEEVAYQHWHRMLFARFLAENDLLMHPGEHPVPVTLEECEELAAEEGVNNGWELAAHYAARMLPQIFLPDSPVFKLQLPPESEMALETKVADLPKETFTASDALGWIYQFWQSKRKEEVNLAEVKIGARELPSVTQLFTEPYMVSFLLDNSLGAWWAARQITDTDWLSAETEEELRSKAAIAGLPLTYLRFAKIDDGAWSPAAGRFENWPNSLSEFKMIDPCCGSGHFLVATLLMLVPMRMELENLTAREAIDRVLAENISGLELDRRCVELAAFALALTAWRYPNAGGYRPLPDLNIACTGQAVSGAKSEWKQFSIGKDNLRLALDWMHDAFAAAPTLGSLIDPSKVGASKIAQWADLSSVLANALRHEQTAEEREAAVVAHGLAKASMLLAGRYNLVLTNVPYLARGKQGEVLRDFCETHYPEAKSDLATVFLLRCLELCCNGGTASVVLPQNWLFLTSYRKLREKLLRQETWNMIARLGEGGFESTAAAGAFTVLLTITRGIAAGKLPDSQAAELQSSSDCESKSQSAVIRGLDVSASRNAAEKAAELKIAAVKSVWQMQQLDNPDARVTFERLVENTKLADIANYGKGSTTGDSPRFLMYFWEFDRVKPLFVYWLNSPKKGAPWSGRETVCTVPLDSRELKSQLGCRLHGQQVFGRKGVAVNKMRQLEPFFYLGEVFDDNVCPICPHDRKDITAIYCYVESERYSQNVRAVDQALKVTAATLTKVPFDSEHWSNIANENYPDGFPEPFSEDPTQWLFHGFPTESEQPLQVAVARLLGYQWPGELDSDMELAQEARELIKKSAELLVHADEDGIACIPSVRGEAPAVDRLHNLLAAAYGKDWTSDKLSELLAQVGYAGKTLESWLREAFFTQHCQVFQHRPFIWHIWDGLRDGFGALVNYHKLDKKLLESLIYTYLGDWISRQKQDIEREIDGAQEKLAAAEQLQKKLELILKGESPHDIFIRWKAIENQPMGWEPDINDGVRLNIRPFLSVSDVAKKGAGVLRDKPNINWNKDRGKDVESAPWYHLFKGDRINDHHLTLAEKQASKRLALAQVSL